MTERRRNPTLALSMYCENSWGLGWGHIYITVIVTLVILSALPVIIIVQTLSQAFANPLLLAEREPTGVPATMIDRVISAIATAKAFNAAAYENSRATF
jgi:hypothetical protein